MRNLLEKLDELADINTENFFLRWIERIVFVFLILMFVSAPHSIAATQTAWLVGMFLWLVRMIFRPRPRFVRTPLDLALWSFLGWSIVTSIFSYAPDISIDRLRGTLLFLIFYFVVNVARTKRCAVFLVYAIIFSSLVSAVWMPVQRLIGRGVEIHGVAPDSTLTKSGLTDGDTLLEINGKKIKTPDDLIPEIEANKISKVKFYRPDFELVVDVWQENTSDGANALERLGIQSWKRSHNWRSTGFYSHYVTYAEVLQLLAALAFGLLIASFINYSNSKFQIPNSKNFLARLPFSLFFFFAVAALALALLLTVTRASQLGFLVAAAVIVFAVGNRRLMFGLALVILPVAVGGLIFLQQSRRVGMIDQTDDSTLYRETMYRDGLRLWTSSARNFSIGVGMDSVQRYWQEWNLFDGGRLPRSHFHSTPIQLLVERGLPALLIWLWILFVYGNTLIRFLKRSNAADEKTDWRETGIVLGCLGGIAGFFTSGLVHYNLGDAEVAMVLYMLMGISISITNFKLRMCDEFVIRNLKFAHCFKRLSRFRSGQFSYTNRGALSRVRWRRARCSSDGGRARL